jgi:hypothetical protein
MKQLSFLQLPAEEVRFNVSQLHDMPFLFICFIDSRGVMKISWQRAQTFLKGIFPLSNIPIVGQGLHIIGDSLHTQTHHTRYDSSGRVISPTQSFYLTTYNVHKTQNFISTAGFEPAIPANERQQTESLDRAANGTGP